MQRYRPTTNKSTQYNRNEAMSPNKKTQGHAWALNIQVAYRHLPHATGLFSQQRQFFDGCCTDQAHRFDVFSSATGRHT